MAIGPVLYKMKATDYCVFLP